MMMTYSDTERRHDRRMPRDAVEAQRAGISEVDRAIIRATMTITRITRRIENEADLTVQDSLKVTLRTWELHLADMRAEKESER